MVSYAKDHKGLYVYQSAISAAMEIFHLSSSFPHAERYNLTDQIRRSSRSICANIAEAWRKRRYKAAFIAKLSDAETEAGETQVWIELACRCGYIMPERAGQLDERIDLIIKQIVYMISHSSDWTPS